MGEAERQPLRVDFDRRLKLEFHGSRVTSDAGLLPYRELDDALGLIDPVGDVLSDRRTGKNGRHGMTGLFRQSVFCRLGGYDDVNDADRLGRDPAMRWIVGGHAVNGRAASTSQMGRFETELLVQRGIQKSPLNAVTRCTKSLDSSALEQTSVPSVAQENWVINDG